MSDRWSAAAPPQLRFVSSGAAELLRAVDRSGKPLAAATAGLSMFHDGRRPADVCRHRPRTEGLQALLPYLLPTARSSRESSGSLELSIEHKRSDDSLLVHSAGAQSSGRCVEVGTVFLLNILKSGRIAEEDCPAELQALSPGACVVTATAEGSKLGGPAAAVAWKGESGIVQLHADAAARRALLTLLMCS